MRPNAGRLSSPDSSAHGGGKRLGPNKRLDSWKAIGAYLKRDERTVRRWEDEGLPVYRHVHAKKASIYAYTAEIDAWWSKGSTRPEVAEAVPPHSSATIVELLDDAASGKTRVAVLPFENLTRQQDDDWLAAAFSDSLTFGLQSLDNLLLVSRASIAQAYRDHALREADRLEPQTVERFARSLGVRYYVHGSYQKVADQLRVVARLVEIGSGAIRAQESVTDEAANLLQLEDELARRFGANLKFGSALPRRRPQTALLEAYRAVTIGRGLYLSTRYDQALQVARRAVDLDPLYAEAWALIGKSYARLASANYFAGGSLRLYRTEALAAATRAADLDPSSYEAHVGLALACRRAGHVHRGRIAAQKAIELNPRLAEGYALMGDSYSDNHLYGYGHDRNGSLAISYYRQALRLEPTYQEYWASVALNLLFAGQDNEALRVAYEGLRLHPASQTIRHELITILFCLNRFDEGERVLNESIHGRTPTVEEQIRLADLDLRRGKLEEAASRFSKALSLAPPERRISVARAYFMAGLVAPGLDHLEQAFQADSDCPRWLLATQSAIWTPLRGIPEVRALLAKYVAD
jgi:TolB-like protein/Flp pilus assembly protein TadD